MRIKSIINHFNMGKIKNTNLGKAVGKHFGYTIRHIVTSKTDEKTKKTFKLHNGKFGIYAGKEKVDEVGSKSEALVRINTIVRERKPKWKAPIKN